MLLRDIAPAEDGDLARALLAVQHSAYAVEAALIGDDRIPPMHEDIDDLRRAPLSWLAAFVDDRLAGAIAWADTVDEIDVDRLMVAPSAHRRGVALTLVREVLRRAGTRRAVVSTGRDNAPAMALYVRLGFSRVDDREVLPGLWVTRLAHPA